MNYSLRSPHRAIDLSTPQVMAIINVTPDSFFPGSRFLQAEEALEKVGLAIEFGANMLDIGAVSTRPGADIPSPSEEQDRLLPVLEAVRHQFPGLWISLDTWRAATVRACADFDIDMVNDISGGTYDQELWPAVRDCQLSYVLMHMPNPLEKMHQLHEHPQGVIHSMGYFFHEKIKSLLALGVQELVIDPGFGFGKSLRDNHTALLRMSELRFLQRPILAGVSRKSMIQKVLGVDVSQAQHGTTILHTIALQQGAKILRVHDVKAAAECVQMYNFHKSLTVPKEM